LVTPVPLSPLLLLCCAYGGGSIKISLQAMPYKGKIVRKFGKDHWKATKLREKWTNKING
jgi:hypothetical protein